ncbi:MAG: glycosyltransferase family 9 protein [Acidobacteria bacterium]|nr:glycosyltransferase family 9 protein [Acidobacteriota bacterium]
MSGPRILVIRIGSMGDVIHALPAVATLKHSFPGSTLSWVVDRRWAPLVEGNPFVDRGILFERSLQGLRETWRELRAGRFTLAVDFQGLMKSALVALAAHPERIYGFHQSQVREKPAALAYSNRVRTSAAHVVDRNLELAVAAGATSILCTFPLPEGSPAGDLPAGAFVLANPLAGWRGKQWPHEYYARLGWRLLEELGMPLVLNGPPGTASLLRSIANTRTHLCGLPGLIHATRRAAAVVGIDSGPLHLAAALSKPGVAVFGPTDPARNGPYPRSFTVLRSPSARTTYRRRGETDPSMREISPDAVFEALKIRLGAWQAG